MNAETNKRQGENQDQKILNKISYNAHPSDMEVFIIRYHVNSSEEMQSNTIDLTGIQFKEWRQTIEASLKSVCEEPIISWRQMSTEFECSQWPGESGWVVDEQAEAGLEG